MNFLLPIFETDFWGSMISVGNRSPFSFHIYYHLSTHNFKTLYIICTSIYIYVYIGCGPLPEQDYYNFLVYI